MNEKSYGNILIYGILYKQLIDARHLRVIFDKVDGLMTDYNGTKYLILIGTENYNAIFDMIRYLIIIKLRKYQNRLR